MRIGTSIAFLTLGSGAAQKHLPDSRNTSLLVTFLGLVLCVRVQLDSELKHPTPETKCSYPVVRKDPNAHQGYDSWGVGLGLPMREKPFSSGERTSSGQG